MAMALLRREGKRIVAPMAMAVISPQLIRSSLSSTEEQAALGVRYISTHVGKSRLESSRGLWQPFTALLGDTPSVDVKKNVTVTISSDKGLCDGINSTAVKISRGLHKLNSGPEKENKYVILGEMAKAQLARDSKKDIELCITELQKNPLNYTQVAVLADEIVKKVEYDALRIVYNKFHSDVSFVPSVSTVLSPQIVEREAEAGGKLRELLDSYEIETKSQVLRSLTEFQFSCVLFNAVLENACSVQGARMSAIDDDDLPLITASLGLLILVLTVLQPVPIFIFPTVIIFPLMALTIFLLR